MHPGYQVIGRKEIRKAQKNTRKKSMKAVNSELIQHFVPHFQQSNGL